MPMTRMRSKSGWLIGVAALLLLGAREGGGQTRTGPTSAFELGAGPIVGQGTGLGIHTTGGYVTAPTRFGLAIRLEGTFATWRSLPDPTRLGGTRVSSLGVSLVQTLWSGPIRPYVAAGVGGYAERGAGFAFGGNVGAGFRFRLGSASLFTELRVHRLRAGDQGRLEPLTLGVRF
jgi:hypothetical protein